MVEGMRVYFGADGVDRIPQREGEALIRDALGEQVPAIRMSADTAFAIRGLVAPGGLS